MKNEEDLLVAIGNKTIILGEADKNELKEKQSNNWKNISLSLLVVATKTNNRKKKRFRKGDHQSEADLKVNGRSPTEKVYHGRMLSSDSG